MIGTTIGNFRIIEKIGEGGMGVVYKAQDIRLDRPVALKFLPERFSVTEEERARFLQEAKSAATLNHPNVCTIHGVEEHGSQQFIQMEFIEGQTLHALAQAGGLAPAQALDYAIQIAEALQEAHGRGIVHRDIKSENIMINTRKQVKVMDFGLAKLRGSLKLTKASSTVGTLGYMAPEQIQGNEADARADLFSFGVVLYEMLTGRLPFRGEHEAALMYSILNEEPQPLSTPGGEAVPELEHIIGKALEKNPDERYQSAQDLLVDLRRARKQSGRVSRISAATVPVQRGPSSLPPQEAKKKMRLPLVIGAGLILVITATILLLLPEKHRPFEQIEMRRITSSGSAGGASISPDGKVVAHVLEQGGKSSIWVRQIATGSSVQVVPPFEGGVLGTTITPDGEFLLYVRMDLAENAMGAIYMCPLLGGQPRKVINHVMSSVGVSNDGSRLAFVRAYPSTGEEALMVASLDGSGERKLVVRDGAKDFFVSGMAGPAWSPDDRFIAVSGGTASEKFSMGVLLVSMEDGTETWLGPQSWDRLNRMVWLPDGSGVVFSGVHSGQPGVQLWCVDSPSGLIRRITNDLNTYGATTLGVTHDGRTLVAAMVETRSNIWVVEEGGAGRDRQLTHGSEPQGNAGIASLPDGRVIYTSTAAGNADIWIVNPDGSNTIQLTLDREMDILPAVTPNGASVVFVSSRSGSPRLWKMKIDGTGTEQLTMTEDYQPTISPDGRWVYFMSWAGGNMNVWRVPFEGGTAEMVVKQPSRFPAISRDGKLLACSYQSAEGMPHRIAVFPVEGGEPLAILEDTERPLGEYVVWSADGKSLLYGTQEAGVYNIYAKPITGGPSRRVTQFQSGEIFGFTLSADGRSLVIARGSTDNDVVLITDVP